MLKRTNFFTQLLAVLLVVSISGAGCKKSGGKSSEAEITAFSFVGFESVVPTITATTITVNLPAGTNVAALVANFTTTGTSVKIGDVLQVSGTTPNDFTSSVKYTVTAQDNSTQDYIVTVTEPSNLAEITAFSFDKLTPVVTGTISGKNITVSLPNGADVTALVATFTISKGATAKVGDVLQVSGTTPNNFTSLVTYNITAEDGTTTQNYTVTVTKPSEAKITSFSFADPRGIIDPAVTIDEPNHTINIMVSAGADITKLVATFATSGASVKVVANSQTSGTTPNDFTNPVTYTLTSQDKTVTQPYTVTVTKSIYGVIPDANFRAYIKALNSSVFGTTGYTLDKLNTTNTTITTAPNLDFRTREVADLTGIEYFVGLTKLDCSQSQLKTLDLSKNTALTSLSCYDTKLTSLDLSKNPNLTTLVAMNNQLTYLDISAQKNWATLSVPYTGLNIYYSTQGENPLATLKVNVSAQGQAAVKQAKTNNPSCVISTYTNNSTEVPVSSDYTPQ